MNEILEQMTNEVEITIILKNGDKFSGNTSKLSAKVISEELGNIEGVVELTDKRAKITRVFPVRNILMIQKRTLS